ncbi:MAG: PEP-CTERM sorting domain-containing protein [Planctomycetaceae bacterium]|nr:PEP-CTERM sorting domain-containing protein [Planctomycetaceae bacterium]MBV8556212.1 PEP-CTERM sorting domain-containing protein [Planctomycetaceae bacterium]
MAPGLDIYARGLTAAGPIRPALGSIAGAPEEAAVPEPSTVSILGMGLAGLGVWQRRRARVA